MVVPSDIVLRRGFDNGWRALQVFGIAFSPVGVLEKDSVSSANRHLAVATGIPGKSQAGRGIEQVTAQTTAGYAARAALHHAIERIAGSWNERPLLPGDTAIDVELRGNGRIIGGRAPVRNQVVPFPERSEKADAQPKIQREVFTDVVVVLEVGLEDLEVDVIFRLRAGLGKVGDVSHQQIGDGIP